jgi:hypothetical protein
MLGPLADQFLGPAGRTDGQVTDRVDLVADRTAHLLLVPHGVPQ